MIIQIIALWTEWSIPVTNHKSFNWFSVLWLCVFSHRKVQSFLFLKDRNKDAELLQNAWLFNPRVVWASISVNESFRLLNSVGGGSGVLAADVQNKPFCGGMGDSGEYQMIHMVTTKSFATRGWMVAVSGGIRIAVSIPFKNKWRACEDILPSYPAISSLVRWRPSAYKGGDIRQVHLWPPIMGRDANSKKK